jgi:6-phospho-beta-glucosidase
MVVLGGSSPFTVGLVDALRARGGAVPPHELVLHGRQTAALQLVARYAANALAPLGWSVREACSLDAALPGAGIIIHQIRYGGLGGRASDEALSERFGLPADETLGIGGIRGLLRAKQPVSQLGARIAAECPDAWCLNLVNPLSAVTTLLSEAGVTRCVGLCELPRTTAREAASRLGLPPDGVHWTYAGLNHRGFICQMLVDGVDHLPRLPEALDGRAIQGIDAATISEIGALPLKYFRIVSGGAPAVRGRADQVEAIREAVLLQLSRDCTASPPALRRRDISWYRDAVVPMVEALYGQTPTVHVVNRPGPGGITVEIQALVSERGVEPLPPGSPALPAARWLERFRENERAVLAAARHPDPRTLREALASDPSIPLPHVGALSEAVFKEYREAPAVELR